jgi:hypothetical protein
MGFSVTQMVQQQTVLRTKNNGNSITEIFILIIASIYLLKIVVAKLQKKLVFKYHNITIIHLLKITEM